MTTVTETRTNYKNGQTYNVQVPLARASEQTYRKYVAETLREFLFREGCRVHHLEDETLLMQVRHTFQSTRAQGGLMGADPIQSEQANQPVPKEEPCL